MKINTYRTFDAYDRPDYDKIHRASYGKFADRLAIAKQLIRDGHTHCRAFDNCFEMGDGSRMVHALVGYALETPEFLKPLGKMFDPDQLDDDGIPKSWGKTWSAVESESFPLFASCAL